MAESLGLVTVVVSVYNIEALLPRCLDCISAQTYRDLEILLIDDGSTDGSGRLCDAFAATDPRARVIHQENRGLWAVRNRGLAEAKGEYLVFPDGDDYFHKDYIFWLVQAINWGGKKYPMAICDHIQTMTGREDTTSDSTPSFEVLDQSFLLDRIICFPDCMYAEWGANWNKIYRKSILPDSFQKPYPRCQDFDSNLRVFFLTEQAVYVHKVLYYWFQWPGQSTRSQEDQIFRNECRCRIFLDHYLSVPPQFSEYRSELLANVYRRLIIWKESVRGTAEERAVTRKIWEIEKQTYPFFFVSKHYPICHKIRWVLSLHAPRLLKGMAKRIPHECA